MVLLMLVCFGAAHAEDETQEDAESISIGKVVNYIKKEVGTGPAEGEDWPKLDDPEWEEVELTNAQVTDALGQQLDGSAWVDGFIKFSLLSRVKLDLDDATDDQIEAIIENLPRLKNRPTGKAQKVNAKRASSDVQRINADFQKQVAEFESLNRPTLLYRKELIDLLPLRDRIRLNYVFGFLHAAYSAGIMDNVIIPEAENRMKKELTTYVEESEVSRSEIEHYEIKHYRRRIRKLALKRVIHLRYTQKDDKAVPVEGSVGLTEEKRDELLELLDPKPSLLD